MKCECTTKHVPKPTIFYHLSIKGKEITLCPTSYFNYFEYLAEWDERGERPPGSIRKHFSAYIQNIVEMVKNGI